MHIYQWQIDPFPSSNRAYIYATPLNLISFTYRGMHIYTKGRWPPSQLTIAACKIITPHKFHTQDNAYIYQRQMDPLVN